MSDLAGFSRKVHGAALLSLEHDELINLRVQTKAHAQGITFEVRVVSITRMPSNAIRLVVRFCNYREWGLKMNDLLMPEEVILTKHPYVAYLGTFVTPSGHTLGFRLDLDQVMSNRYRANITSLRNVQLD